MTEKEALKQIMTDGFDDCMKKAALEAARARIETIDTFAKVLDWNDDTKACAIFMSLGTETVTTATVFNNNLSPQGHIAFVDGFAESIRRQVRARYEKSK